MQPPPLTSSTSKTLVNSLPPDVMNHLFEIIGQMYQLTSVHYVWNDNLDNMEIREQGRIGIYPTLEMAKTAMDNRVKNLSEAWLRSVPLVGMVNVTNINRDQVLELDYKDQNGTEYAAEQYIHKINRVLEPLYQ